MSKKQKRILVDMACSVLHHGHIRILKKAYKFGKVIVALTSDKQILKYKKFKPKLNFKNRKEPSINSLQQLFVKNICMHSFLIGF